MIDPEYRLPTVDEVLAGESQGGVPRPAVLDTDWANGPPNPEWQDRPARMTRWQAVKALLRVIFGKGDRP